MPGAPVVLVSQYEGEEEDVAVKRTRHAPLTSAPSVGEQFGGLPFAMSLSDAADHEAGEMMCVGATGVAYLFDSATYAPRVR